MASGGRKSQRKSRQTVFWDVRNINKDFVSVPATKATKDEEEARRSSELTERELRLGKATWAKHVDAQPTEFRQMVFDELFRCHPEYEFFFMKMLDNTGRSSSVFSHPSSKSHMYDRIIPKLKEIFENLDEPDVLQGIMTKLGLYHAKMRLNRKHMTDMIKILVSCVDKLTGYKLQKDEEYALDKCLNKAFAIAIDSMEQWARNNPEQATSAGFKGTVPPKGAVLKRVESKSG